MAQMGGYRRVGTVGAINFSFINTRQYLSNIIVIFWGAIDIEGFRLVILEFYVVYSLICCPFQINK